jgi:dihydrofolate reductase
MGRLIYSAIASLDGYTADDKGSFDWAVPDEEVHTFINDLQRSVGTYLFGRRMYETMTAWETVHPNTDLPQYMLDFAGIWQAADKIVYSRTLESVATARTRIERELDIDAVRQLKQSAVRDIAIGGPELAGHAIRAGLVDEWRLYVTPVIIGSGKPALPDDVRVDLELIDERRFGNGMAYLHYRTAA